jgi:hypothetical protein
MPRGEMKRAPMKRFIPRLSQALVVTRSLLLTLAAAGCLGSTDPSADPPCTVTITGAPAIAGTYTCSQRAVAVWVPTTNATVVAVNISGSKSITGLFALPGQPTAGATYSTDKTPANLQSYGFIVTVGTASWEFSAGQQKTPLGSGSMTLSSVSAGPAQASGTAYIVHGTVDGNLVPSPGTPATGNATIHVDF